MDQFTLTHDLAALAQVVLIDVTLAGDNAVVVGLAVAGLARDQKRPAILLGIAGATIIRIVLGAIALQLLAIIGLLLAGGVLLLWVCWRMYRELRRAKAHAKGEAMPRKTLGQAMTQIILADVSMSLDNVLAVAGAAAGQYLGPGDRPAALRGADGRRGQPPGQPVGAPALDRLGRPGDRALRRRNNDLGWVNRGCARRRERLIAML